MSVWKSDETLLSICILNFSFKNDFVWEEISNIRHSVSSPDETPRSSSKILRCASYFQLSSRCFIWWWNTASHVWYITSFACFCFRCHHGYDFWLTHEIKVNLSSKRGYWLKFSCRNSKPPGVDFVCLFHLSDIPLLSHDKLLLRPSMKLQLYRKRWKF